MRGVPNAGNTKEKDTEKKVSIFLFGDQKKCIPGLQEQDESERLSGWLRHWNCAETRSPLELGLKNVGERENPEDTIT
ncbi:hypothetical protein MUG91_G36n2 [Manis pentadactyla]|nr:hypothetical protein MUG91_G36n2 [Manis pentadactyla]